MQRNLRWHKDDTSANQKLLFSRSVRISPRAFLWQRSFILDNILSNSNLWPGTQFSLRGTHSFCFKCFRRHMLLEICSKCEILLKCCPKCEKCLRVLKMQNSAPNSKKCSKGAQGNRERPNHKWNLCQISRTNNAIICLYHYPQKVCNFHM